MWHPQFRFPASLKSGSLEDCMSYFEKGFVLKHAMIQRVQDELTSGFFCSSEQQIAMVVGPTGVGKSCLAHAIFKESYRNIPEGEFLQNLPMVYFETDVHSTGGFSWKDFYLRLLWAMGELEEIRVYGKPLPVGDSGARKYNTRNRTEHGLRKDLEQRLKEYGVKYILLDEIQHIFKYGGKTADRSLDILKNISNKTGCRFIGLGTYEISFSIEKSAQLSRRILTLEFPGYDIGSKADFQNFLSAYMGLLAHLPTEISRDVAGFSKEVYVGCCGCIGVLKEWLNRALRRALTEKVELTVSILKSTRLKGSQLKTMAEEIREGKVFFVEPDDGEVLELLGVDTKEEAKTSSTKGARKKSKPGVRNPTRDEVS